MSSIASSVRRRAGRPAEKMAARSRRTRRLFSGRLPLERLGRTHVAARLVDWFRAVMAPGGRPYGAPAAAGSVRLRMEPLEERRLLAAFYVNDDWNLIADNDSDNMVSVGDTVQNDNDSIDLGTVTATYGTDAFGTVTTTGVGGVPVPMSLPAYDEIQDAIDAATAGDTIHVLPARMTKDS